MERLQKGGLPSPNGHKTVEAVMSGFAPQYVFSSRLVGRLACGELAIEPVLGPVRVTEVKANDDANETGDTGCESYVHVRWRDEHGPSTATGRYPGDRSFDVRMPDHHDRLLVRRGIDHALRYNRNIADDTARLIAAHLHSGKKSALHGFMVDGRIDDMLYDELDIAKEQRQYAGQWIDALARYCVAREDTGPIAAWTRQAVTEGEARAEEWLKAAGVSVDQLIQPANGNGRDRNNRHHGLLAKKSIKAETAVQLIEAAFVLGLEARRAGKIARDLRRAGDIRPKQNRLAA